MNFYQFLLSSVGPILVRALAFLGITAATVTGVDAAFSSLVTSAQQSYSGLPSAVLSLAGLAGIPQALGVIFGAFNARITLWVALASSRWIVKK